MSQAYAIEVSNRTVGIVVREERGFRFFSSERTFDILDGGHFRSAHAAERAARALVERRAGNWAAFTLGL
ncbi:hypothetical protein [Bradyrhizobium icense]|uniref:Uncharacterized protein n=1 Tax=Bradyrhizobium icense TaxID=1274631 RepID=A0A1B1UJ13_9BRAD|nr:hypothetical protein [Bradyrhizobium icense]ANW02740.1 hypothetical protein LMTR13_23815 [Bradyrhizobium icense]